MTPGHEQHGLLGRRVAVVSGQEVAAVAIVPVQLHEGGEITGVRVVEADLVVGDRGQAGDRIPRCDEVDPGQLAHDRRHVGEVLVVLDIDRAATPASDHVEVAVAAGEGSRITAVIVCVPGCRQRALHVDVLVLRPPIHAVVGSEQQHRVVPSSGCLEVVDQQPHLRVGVLDRGLAPRGGQAGCRSANLIDVAGAIDVTEIHECELRQRSPAAPGSTSGMRPS